MVRAARFSASNRAPSMSNSVRQFANIHSVLFSELQIVDGADGSLKGCGGEGGVSTFAGP